MDLESANLAAGECCLARGEWCRWSPRLPCLRTRERVSVAVYPQVLVYLPVNESPVYDGT